MPMYTYECAKCGKEWEGFTHRVNGTATCECGGYARRLLHAGRPTVVVDDTYPHPVQLTSLNTIDPGNPLNEVRSHSERRRLMKRHDEIHNTQLVFER